MARRISREAKETKPYLVKTVQDMIRRGGAGMSGGAGFVVSSAPPHSLASHTGVLLDTQAPQFVLLDGSRQLTGNWSVAPGVEIDGVDISAHAADLNIHHNRDHVLATNAGLGGTHTISGAAAGQVLRASSATAANFQKLNHTDLDPSSVTEDQHHAKNHPIVGTGTTHTYAGGSALDVVGLTAPGTLGMLTPSADVSAGVAAILKSTTNGKLTLKSLETHGALDVLSGGDFTVGATLFYVDGTNGLVSINGPADPQHALTVHGSVVARYFIGKHAIALPETILLSHFDGTEPYNINPIGDWHSRQGHAPITSGDMICRPGLYEGALLMAGTYSNSALNPQYNGGSAANWLDYSSGSATGTRAVTDEDAYVGAYSYKLAKTGGGLTDAWGTQQNFTVSAAGENHTYSVWVKVIEADTAGEVKAEIQAGIVGTPFTNANTTVLVAQDLENPANAGALPFNEWVRIAVKNTSTGTGTGQIRVRISSATTATILVSAHMRGALTSIHRPYVETSHAANTLRYDNVAVLWRRMTWLVSAFPVEQASAVGNNLYLGNIYASSGNQYQLYIHTSNKVRFAVSGTVVCESSTTITPGEWWRVAVTVAGRVVKLFIDGVLEDTQTMAALPVGLPDVYVGDIQAGGQRINGLIDEFVITGTTEPDKRILAIHESDAPVFAETPVRQFSLTPRQLVIGNQNGLFVRDVNGWAVAGFYGGEQDDFDWGGFTLNRGDIAFGRYGVSGGAWGPGGWMLFDRDGVNNNPYLTLGYDEETIFEFDEDGGRINGVLQIGPLGELRQGIGVLGLGGNFTGTRIWTEDIGGSAYVGTIAGYNNNVIQWQGTTAGDLEAGGGSLRLNRLGMLLKTSAGLTFDLEHAISWWTDIDGAVSDIDAPAAFIEGFANGARLWTQPQAPTVGTEISLWARVPDATTGNGASILMQGHNTIAANSSIALAANFITLTGEIDLSGVVGPVHIRDNSNPVGLFERSVSALTSSFLASFTLRATTDGASANGFGPAMDFDINDSSTTGLNPVARIGARRSGADNSADFTIATASAGTLSERIRITTNGLIGVNLSSGITAQLDVLSASASRLALNVNSSASPTVDIARFLRDGAERVTITKEGWLKVVNPNASGGGDNVGGRLYLQSVKGSAGAAFDMAGQLRFGAKNAGGTDKVFVDINGQIDVATAGSERGGLYINVQHGGQDAIPFAAVGANVSMLRGDLWAVDFKGAEGVIHLAQVTTAPTAAPDAQNPGSSIAGGVFIWWDGTNIRYRKPGGASTIWV